MSMKEEVESNIVDKARSVFDAIIRGGDVYAEHNDENIKLKTVALSDGKLIGVISTNSGSGVKLIDITKDRIVKVSTEVVFDE